MPGVYRRQSRRYFRPPARRRPAPRAFGVTAPLSSGVLSFAYATSAAVRLTWTDAAGGFPPKTYNVHRAATTGFSPGPGNLLASGATSPYDDSTAAAATLYYYKVVAVDAASQTVTSNQVSAGLPYNGTGGTLLSPDDVRSGVDRGDGTVGTIALPLAANVRAGTQYGAGSVERTGTLALPAAADVRTAVAFGAGGTEFAGSCAVPPASVVLVGAGVDAGTGTLVLPNHADVRSAVSFGVGGAGDSGTLVVPAAAGVLSTVTYDNGTAGTYAAPAANVVKAGTAFGAGGAVTGTYTVTLPAAANVRSGVAYGSPQSSLTGTFVVSYAAASDVRLGTDRGDGTLGTLAVPAAAKVLAGESVGAATGTLLLPDASAVLLTNTYGVGGTGSAGTVRLPAAGRVELGYHYGAADALVGTLSGGGGGIDPGGGDTQVTQDAGGTDNLRVTTRGGVGIAGAVVSAYLATEWDADSAAADRKGQAVTGSDGRWLAAMQLDTGFTYVFAVDAAGYADKVRRVEI